MKKDLLNAILNDMRVELTDEFDQNFARGGFFGSAWKGKLNGDPSKLQDTGKLRRSIRGRTQRAAVVFSSSEPNAKIHNDGGEITITRKMQKFFWAKYYANGKKGKKAEYYKALALKKVGSKLTIPQRQFIGDHQTVRRNIQTIVTENVERAAVGAFQHLNKK